MKKGRIVRSVFLCYLALLLFVLLFAHENDGGGSGYNTQLLAEIERYLRYRQVLGIKLVLRNLLGNIVGFLPFGYLLPEVNQKYEQFWRTTRVIALFSLTIEVFQLLTRVGCFDVDDILLNALGGACGYGLRCCIRTFRKEI